MGNVRTKKANRFFSKLAKEIETDRGIEALTFEIMNRIIAMTPVDTSRARSGWSYRMRGNVGVITNPLPYIRRLEYGWSKQAPNGMARVVLRQFGDGRTRIGKGVKAAFGSDVRKSILRAAKGI